MTKQEENGVCNPAIWFLALFEYAKWIWLHHLNGDLNTDIVIDLLDGDFGWYSISRQLKSKRSIALRLGHGRLGNVSLMIWIVTWAWSTFRESPHWQSTLACLAGAMANMLCCYERCSSLADCRTEGRRCESATEEGPQRREEETRRLRCPSHWRSTLKCLAPWPASRQMSLWWLGSSRERIGARFVKKANPHGLCEFGAWYHHFSIFSHQLHKIFMISPFSMYPLPPFWCGPGWAAQAGLELHSGQRGRSWRTALRPAWRAEGGDGELGKEMKQPIVWGFTQ